MVRRVTGKDNVFFSSLKLQNLFPNTGCISAPLCTSLAKTVILRLSLVSWGEFCLSFPTMISNVWCLEICTGTLFLMFGAVLSIICGFLMAIYTWIHLQQCIVVVRSFLRILKLRKLAVRKLYLSRGGGRTWCQGVLEHWLNLHQNIPLSQDVFFCFQTYS